jgi:ATP:ADP antiporter, AAA family
MTSRHSNPAIACTVTLAAITILMQQVAGKAARDAMFLAHFDVRGLPAMIIISSILSVAAGLLFSRSLSKVSPMRLLPVAFLGSAVLLAFTWWLTGPQPKLAAVLLYLQMGTMSPILISGFWSLLNERFDPQSAKPLFAQVGVGACVGGLAGGVMAGWIASTSGLLTMLPVLSALNLIAGLLLFPLRRGSARDEVPEEKELPYAASGVQTVLQVSHLRNLGMVVLAGTVSAALIDYVFKAQASAAFRDGEQLLRFFGVFYTLAGVLTLVVQVLMTRVSMDKLGLSGMVASLPTTVLAGSIGGLFVPGLASAAVARAGESVLRSSLFRSSYELFYTPLPRDQKRAAKPIIDVSVERLGDAIGAVMIQLLLVAGAQGALTSMLLTSLVIATTTLVISYRLPGGYREALETSLLSAPVEWRAAPNPFDGFLSVAIRDDNNDLSFQKRTGRTHLDSPMRRMLLHLASDDPDVLRATLARMKPLDSLAVPRVIQLLGRDDVAVEASESLREIAGSITGQLLDVLADPRQDPVLRTRVAGVLSGSPSAMATAGLLEALSDPNFDLRFQATMSLEAIRDRSPDQPIDSERVINAVIHELALHTSREVLRLEHVFRLLALVFPKDPLRVAYRVLLSDDASLNGTAMEYLETVLPPVVWQRIRRLIEMDPPRIGVA